MPLDLPTNSVNNIAGQSFNVASFKFSNAGPIHVTTVAGNSGIYAYNTDVMLRSYGGGITQDARISANSLEVIAAGPVNLDATNNQVNFLAGSSVGGFRFHNGFPSTTNLTIGFVGATNGVTNSGTGLVWIDGAEGVKVAAPIYSGGRDITLAAGGSFDLVIQNNVDSGAARTTLSAGDTISQSGGTIIAGDLVLSAVNGIGCGEMCGGSQLQTQVTNLQATNTSNGVEIHNTGDLTLKDLGAGYAIRNTNGAVRITTGAGNEQPGNLTVSDSVTAGKRFRLRADGDLFINANVSGTGLGGDSTSELIADGGEFASGTGGITQNASSQITVTDGGNLNIGVVCAPGDGCGPYYGDYTQNIVLGKVNAGTGTVMIRTVNGGVQDANGPGILNITAGDLVIRSEQGINLDTAVSRVDLFNGTFSGAGNIAIRNTGGLAVDDIYLSRGVENQGGTVTLTASGPLTIDSGVSAYGGIVLKGTGFTNNVGAGALSTPGRWLVYVPNPGSVTKNGLVPTFYQYNTSYPGTVAPTGNGFVYVSPLRIDAAFSGTLSSTFGSSPTATPGYVLHLLDLDSDDTTTAAAITGSAAYSNWPITASTAAGTYALRYASGLSASPYYTLAPGTAQTYTVNQALLQAIVASLTGTSNKTYDATTDATLAPGNFVLSGFVSTDSASVTKTTGTYASKNVGSGILVSTTLAATDFSPVGSTNLSNYTLPTSASGNIGNITPATLSLSGLTASNKVYDATTAAAVSGTLGGVLGTDVVTLSRGSFNDKNVGTAKPVTVTSLGLTGANAGNYVLSGATTTTADITVRPLSTWIGGAAGDWSIPANWDALPDLSNVTAVSVPAGMTVIYDAAAGDTNLGTLTADGLTIAGGSLSIGNGLTVNSSFSQTGGTLSFGSSAGASITQASGNLNLPAFTVPSLSLNAPAGAITQSGPILATVLNTQSQTGTTLNNTGNRVGSFAATNSGSGNVALTNTGALTITGISNIGGNVVIDNTGAVTTVGVVSAPSGSVSIIAHSPLDIGAGGVSAGGDIVLAASETPDPNDTLTLSGPVSSTGSGGSVALSSGDDLLQNANVTTNGGAVTAVSQTGNISMVLGTTTTTTGGGIGYTAPSGNVALTSLDAGSGAINLNAGGDISTVLGFTGANLIGGQALIVAGGDANLSTQVGLLDVKVNGTYSITDVLTGSVITNVRAATPVLNQVTSTVVAATQSVTTQPAKADDKDKEDDAKKRQQATLTTTTGAGTDVKPKNFCN